MSNPVGRDPVELRNIQHLEAHLVSLFSPPLSPEEVQRCLLECYAAYESAPVRAYLPILVGRSAFTRLRQTSDRGRAGMIGALK